MHVKVRTRNLPSPVLWRFSSLGRAVHLEIAGTVFAFLSGHVAEGEVGAIRVQFPNRRNKVVKVRFHGTELSINTLLGAAFAALECRP